MMFATVGFRAIFSLSVCSMPCSRAHCERLGHADVAAGGGAIADDGAGPAICRATSSRRCRVQLRGEHARIGVPLIHDREPAFVAAGIEAAEERMFRLPKKRWTVRSN